MEQSKKKRIKLSVEVDINKKNHEKRYEQSYLINSLDSNVWPYDILRIVFRYLNAKDLSNVAIVCRSWSEAAVHEKISRGFYLSVIPESHIKKFDDGKKEHECVLIEIGEGMCFDCIHHNITQATFIPAIAFIFSDCKSEAGVNFEDYRVEELFPKNCEIITLYADTNILSKYNGNYKCISRTEVICALLPQIFNIEISVIEIPEKYFHMFRTFEDEYIKYMDMIDRASKQSHEMSNMSTCLMIFSSKCGNPKTGLKMYTFAQMRLGNDNKNTVLFCNAGEQNIYHYKYFNCNMYQNEPTYNIAILITGSIRTWSIVIDCKHKTREQVEEELKLFKEQVDLQKHSVGFMFGCNIENENHVSNLDKVESFNRLFPKVPLVGCLGECLSSGFDNNGHIISLVKHNCSVTYMILTYGSCVERTL